ncbi:MAG: sugar phosphate isomerase/epimerase [Planctomycetales bacterium]|nr:sugar phosphate isomerase/epimerase [Planctomycetales bacterium]
MMHSNPEVTNSAPTTRRTFVQRTMLAGAALGMVSPAKAAEKAAGPYFEDRGWLLGCWTRPWAAHDYRVGFDAIAEAGFQYVALTGAKTRTGRVISAGTTLEEAAEVGQEARQRGLTITTVYGGDAALEKGPQVLQKMIALCKAAGGWSVMLSSVGKEDSYEASCKALAQCCQDAAAHQLAVVLKPHGGTTGTGPQLRDCLQRVDQPNFTLMYDPGNIFYYSQGKIDPVEDCEAVQGLVTGMSIKDYLPPDQVMLTPGTGRVRFPLLMKKLSSGGFGDGPLMIEALSPGDLPHTLAEAKKAKAFVESWLPA